MDLKKIIGQILNYFFQEHSLKSIFKKIYPRTTWTKIEDFLRNNF